MCEHVKEADIFDDIYIDTNSEEIMNYAEKQGLKVIQRKPELAENTANGNDLLVYHYKKFPEYDFYFQLFATAPYLQPNTIKQCVNMLVNSTRYDSYFTGVFHHGFFG